MRLICASCSRVWLLCGGDCKLVVEDTKGLVCPFCGSKHVSEFKGNMEAKNESTN